jgi:hypothetical protein
VRHRGRNKQGGAAGGQRASTSLKLVRKRSEASPAMTSVLRRLCDSDVDDVDDVTLSFWAALHTRHTTSLERYYYWYSFYQYSITGDTYKSMQVIIATNNTIE